MTGEPESALGMAAAIRNGAMSASEVLERCLGHVEERNRALNAIVTFDATGARAAAARADRAVRAGEPLGPLHGVPFCVKDIIATRGVRTTAGSTLLRDYMPTFTATAVQRLVDAGAILIGKTNCPEFALDLHTANALFGDTWNPWRERCTPGGSSGGDSAAVAAGLVPFSVGSDLGGSIRWPAHCTATFGFRASVGLIPGTGQLPLSRWDRRSSPSLTSMQGRLQVIGPLARTVDDLWAIIAVMAGPDGLDPHVEPVPLGKPVAVDPRQLRCAWMDGAEELPVREDVRRVIAGAVAVLETAGMSTVRDHPARLAGAAALFGRLRRSESQDEIKRLAAGREGELTPQVRRFLTQGDRGATPDPGADLAELTALESEVAQFMEEREILLWPVAGIPAFEVGTATLDAGGSSVMSVDRAIDPCRAISLLRLPVAVVPCGLSADGLPVGVQVVGRRWHDHEVIAVAKLLEAASELQVGTAR